LTAAMPGNRVRVSRKPDAKRWSAYGAGMSLIARLSKIRVRLLLGFLVAFLGMALFGMVSYHQFTRMEQKLVFLSQADSMVNAVLEARRYEKNYFLYQHEEDFRQALAYLDQFQKSLDAERRHLELIIGDDVLGVLLGLTRDYRSSFAQIHVAQSQGVPLPQQAVQNLRHAGKSLIDATESIAKDERSGIHLLLVEYQPLLITFLLVLAGIGGTLIYSLLVRLVKPLATIEEATKVVAEGDFQTIPWADRPDEIGSLVQAFNRMVVHLRQNNEQMVQTEKLTALGTLTSGVAHELNNPLNNISTSCQILQEEMDNISDYHQELLRAVDEQVSKARDIVGSLLEFARQREFELRPEELRTVVDEALKLLRGEIPSGVEVRVAIPPDLVLVMDKAHMVQALLNLILNGVQAMPGGGVLTIYASRKGRDGQVEMVVQDSGPGIQPKVLPRIFDPFYTTKDVGRGTGLGLSITYGIIERHHGHIRADSPPSGGAKFILTLPVDGERS
jgi:two-component system NtrC family sensor kinase